MRHGKNFVDEQGQRTGGYAGVHAARDAAAPSQASEGKAHAAASADPAKRPAARASITIEEMTDRIYRRYAVN